MKKFLYCGKKKTIIAQPDAGLGNRLNSIYSGMYYSRLLNAPLNILWLRENCCNVGFTDLFDIPENVYITTIYHLGYKNSYAFKSIVSDIYVKFFRKKVTYFTSEDTSKLFDEKGEKGILDAVEEADSICFKSYRRHCELEHFKESFPYLKPNEEITKAVSSVMDPLKGKRVIGIHIRRTDHIKAIENSSFESFVSIMERERDNAAGAGTETLFFLATDDESVEQELSGKFSCVPHFRFSSAKSRSTVDGMKDAYVDMLCLSKCEKIYGSFESTFSQMASLTGDVTLEIVT